MFNITVFLDATEVTLVWSTNISEKTAASFFLVQDYLQWRQGRVIAQVVSPWLPTAAARVRARSGHVRFVVDKVALGQVFSEYFGLPCQSSFHQILHPHNHPGQVQ
jgi:hypothetical protein